MEDRILDKIKKCLALSKSSEPEEAAAAMRQAQKLMGKYGISLGKVQASEIGEAKVKSKASVSRVKDWEFALITVVAKAFGCRLMWTSSLSYNKDVFGKFTLVGLKSQVELAQYTCEVMQRKLMKARAEFVSSLYGDRQYKIREADGFCHGWVTTIGKTVIEFAHGAETLQFIHNYIDSKTSGTAKTQRREAGSLGYSAGKIAASGESIHRPMNEAKQSYLK